MGGGSSMGDNELIPQIESSFVYILDVSIRDADETVAGSSWKS